MPPVVALFKRFPDGGASRVGALCHTPRPHGAVLLRSSSGYEAPTGALDTTQASSNGLFIVESAIPWRGGPLACQKAFRCCLCVCVVCVFLSVYFFFERTLPTFCVLWPDEFVCDQC